MVMTKFHTMETIDEYTSESALSYPNMHTSEVEPLHELQRMSWLQVRVMGKLILTNNSFITINLRAQSS